MLEWLGESFLPLFCCILTPRRLCFSFIFNFFNFYVLKQEERESEEEEKRTSLYERDAKHSLLTFLYFLFFYVFFPLRSLFSLFPLVLIFPHLSLFYVFHYFDPLPFPCLNLRLSYLSASALFFLIIYSCSLDD